MVMIGIIILSYLILAISNLILLVALLYLAHKTDLTAIGILGIAFMSVMFYSVFSILGIIAIGYNEDLANVFFRLSISLGGLVFPTLYIFSVLIRRENLKLIDLIPLAFMFWFPIERYFSSEIGITIMQTGEVTRTIAKFKGSIFYNELLVMIFSMIIVVSLIYDILILLKKLKKNHRGKYIFLHYRY